MDFKLVYMQEPTRWEGNGIAVVDWSADGRKLLVQIMRWPYESDVADFDILLYNSSFATFTKPDHNQIFGKHLGKECFLRIRVLGFASDGKVLLEADDYWGEWGSVCVPETSLWLLDPYKDKVSSLPDDYQVQRYGSFEEHKPKD
ncbi:MAG: hypothetical protein ACE5H2_05280 [Terriglobia bacterium]